MGLDFVRTWIATTYVPLETGSDPVDGVILVEYDAPHPRPHYPPHFAKSGGSRRRMVCGVIDGKQEISHGTREDKKAGGDASSFACGYGGQ